MSTYDLTVVGSGPNGLAAAVIAARAGLRVRVIEARTQLGGGGRTAELVESGFRHDVCSAVHPLAAASPFFRAFGLLDRVDFVTPELSLAHILRPGVNAFAYRSLTRTAEALGRDGRAWKRIFGSSAAQPYQLAAATLRAPLAVRPTAIPAQVRVGIAALNALRPGGLRTESARALLAGLFAHAINGPASLSSALIGVTLGAHAHAGGWPIPVGGSQSIIDALHADVLAHGGTVETGRQVRNLDELSDCAAILLAVTPRAFADIAGARLGARAARRYRRFRYGPGVAKVDFTLDGPVPWLDPRLTEAGTVHVGGTAEAVNSAERDITRGRHSDDPFIVASQPTVFDPSRAPAGKHVLWAYAHVPAGSDRDVTETVTSAIERSAPGFRNLIRGSVGRTAVDYQKYNANYVGGDIGSGRTGLAQLVARPVLSATPWVTPVPGVYLCSASTAPGPGVHGMAGWHSVEHMLEREFGLSLPDGFADASFAPPGAFDA